MDKSALNKPILNITTKPLYLNSLTPLRGIAAIWVVIFHLDVCLYYRQLGTLIPHEVTGLITKGYLWVDFFFILSGFIIAHVYGNALTSNTPRAAISSYLLSRLSRLYPLHLFTLAILIVLSSLVPLWHPDIIDTSWRTYFDWSALPSHIFFTNAMNHHVYLSWNIASWSIGAEWWTYVIAAPLLISIKKWRRNITTPSILIAFILLSIMVYRREANTLDITFDYGFYRCFLEFTIGIALHKLYLNETGKNWIAKDTAFLTLCLTIFSIFHWKLNDLLVIPVYAALILAAAHNQDQTKRLLNTPLFQYLGKISYSIYLIHSVWFLVFWFLLPQLTLPAGQVELSAVQKILYVLVFMTLTLLCSHCSYHYIEVKGRQMIIKLGNNFWTPRTTEKASLG